MTEKDRELTEKMLEKAINQQSELFKLQFENLFDKLDSIHTEVKKTNGTVRDHEKRISEHDKEMGAHYFTCPNSAEIDELNKKITAIEKIEVSREAISKFSWKQVTAIGIVVGIVFTILNFIFK